MNRPKSDAFHISEEEKLLRARLTDAATLCEKRNRPVYTDFLSPAEQRIAKEVAQSLHFSDFELWGGHENAERKQGVFIPNRFMKPTWDIDFLALQTRGPTPTHPEILGALIGLGIRREKIGDLIADANPPKIICASTISDFLIENFTKAGHCAFRTVRSEIGEIPPKQTIEKTFTLPSLRLDCLAAEGFGIARTKAADAIRAGSAQLNWRETVSPSAEVGEGDVVSLRGHGRLELTKIGGTSRKDRIFVTVELFSKH